MSVRARRELPTHVLARHARAMPPAAPRLPVAMAEEVMAVVVPFNGGPGVAQKIEHAGCDHADDRPSALGV